MAETVAQAPRPLSRRRPDPWSAAAVLIVLVVLLPVGAVVWMAAGASGNVWPHLSATVLPRYGLGTLTLMAGVGLLTAAVGTGAAWLVVMYRFPGARWLNHALLFPLAIPAYVGAYAVVDFLDYSGVLQTTLRQVAGWRSMRDYWFPAVRSEGFAIVVLAAALYPYVYLLARTAFREASASTYEVARALGAGPWGLFWRVGLPMARPAIATGVALVLMEVVADYGTVAHFGVQTLTTGIFTTWLTANNAGGAAQIALVALAFVAVLVGIERAGRRGARFHRMSRSARPIVAQPLSGWQAGLALLACLVPFAVGFVLPVGVMLSHALAHPEFWAAPGLTRAAWNTVSVGASAAAVTVGGALVVVYAVRLSSSPLPRRLLPLTTLGYAAPGAVLAVGILTVLAAVDHKVADAILALTGHDPGLMMTGTAGALIVAYAVRFFAVAQGAIDSGMGRISPNLPMAARALGRGPGATLRSVHLPLLRGSVGVAALVVFVDCVKELPATLLLRPFNWNTLSTRTFELASLEKLGEAAPAALLVMATGLLAVALLARQTAGRAT